MSRRKTSENDPAMRLVEVHHAFGRAFSRWTQSLIEDAGGSPARMRLLGALHCKGPRIMTDLGEELGVTARQVTNLVDALEREGLVRRVAHPTDRRATVIEITPAGAELTGQMWQQFQERVAALFRELPEPDQHELLRLMETLLGAVRRRARDDDVCGPP
jgi:DNA-binding MarR family transcriptional regulator